ncbi:LLM class flavin-dependent oxidoreductase, partial [Dehalococcoidia bacterium]|nr:LLM class flavin-dependent oxidoreductase [Dehalococcoidia bacterium]MCL0101661.1 LLM class flavin-dependent oxidoreductase [Dehalococcoidia bacterium]
VFSLAGAIAARTKRMRIGTAVVVLPFHNPIEVAEETATLDIVSGGRLEFGVGSGYQRQEFDGIGVNIEESRDRFQEHIEVIRRAWTEDKLTFHGKFTSVDNLQVIPKPVQKPHPPIYIAVSTSPSSIEYAARLGLTPLIGGPTAVMGQVPEVIRLWRDKMEEFGHLHEHIDPPVLMNIYVAPTVEEVRGDAKDREDFSTKILAKIGSPIAKDGTIPQGYEQWADRQKDREGSSDPANSLSLRPLKGSPDVVIERLDIARQNGVKHIFGSFGFPGLSNEKVLRSIDLFATKVKPEFASAGEPVG